MTACVLLLTPTQAEPCACEEKAGGVSCATGAANYRRGECGERGQKQRHTQRRVSSVKGEKRKRLCAYLLHGLHGVLNLVNAALRMKKREKQEVNRRVCVRVCEGESVVCVLVW